MLFVFVQTLTFHQKKKIQKNEEIIEQVQVCIFRIPHKNTNTKDNIVVVATKQAKNVNSIEKQLNTHSLLRPIGSLDVDFVG